MARYSINTQLNQRLKFLRKYGISESYVSLLLGVLAVVIIAIIIFFSLQFVRNQDQKADLTQIREELEKQLNEQEKNAAIYTVKQGDSLSSIAKERYGNLDLWPELARVNKIQNPDYIQTGTKLNLPNLKDYTVKQGETLWSIAVKTYGDGYRWVDIARINNLSNPDWILVGQKLKLPN